MLKEGKNPVKRKLSVDEGQVKGMLNGSKERVKAMLREGKIQIKGKLREDEEQVKAMLREGKGNVNSRLSECKGYVKVRDGQSQGRSEGQGWSVGAARGLYARRRAGSRGWASWNELRVRKLASWQAERYFRVFVERERKGSTIKQFARVEQMRDYLRQVKQDRQVSYWCVFWCVKGTTATRLITSKVEDLCQQAGR